MIATLVGIFINGFSSILTGLNFLVTIHKMRAPGMTWFRLPLFIWSHYATSIIMLLGTPVVAITLSLVIVERVWHVGIFDPAIGGDPILFQHLFWFYSHPAVYIMVLPTMGVVSEIITVLLAASAMFGYEFIAFSSLAIAVSGFWSGDITCSSPASRSTRAWCFRFSASSSPFRPRSKFSTGPRRFTKARSRSKRRCFTRLGFIGLFTIGGLTGLFLATLATDVHVTDTYFIVAHFHYIMVGGAVMGYLGGIHYWWPKITGRMYPEWWGRFAAFVLFVGFNLTFFPQFLLGYLGMPRDTTRTRRSFRCST